MYHPHCAITAWVINDHPHYATTAWVVVITTNYALHSTAGILTHPRNLHCLIFTRSKSDHLQQSYSPKNDFGVFASTTLNFDLSTFQMKQVIEELSRNVLVFA